MGWRNILCGELLAKNANPLECCCQAVMIAAAQMLGGKSAEVGIMAGNAKHQEAFFDTSGLQELFIEEIRDVDVHNGIFHCTLYARRQVPGFSKPVWVPVIPIAIPILSLGQISRALMEAYNNDGRHASKDATVEKIAPSWLH